MLLKSVADAKEKKNVWNSLQNPYILNLNKKIHRTTAMVLWSCSAMDFLFQLKICGRRQYMKQDVSLSLGLFQFSKPDFAACPIKHLPNYPHEAGESRSKRYNSSQIRDF